MRWFPAPPSHQSVRDQSPHLDTERSVVSCTVTDESGSDAAPGMHTYVSQASALSSFLLDLSSWSHLYVVQRIIEFPLPQVGICIFRVSRAALRAHLCCGTNARIPSRLAREHGPLLSHLAALVSSPPPVRAHNSRDLVFASALLRALVLVRRDEHLPLRRLHAVGGPCVHGGCEPHVLVGGSECGTARDVTRQSRCSTLRQWLSRSGLVKGGTA